MTDIFGTVENMSTNRINSSKTGKSFTVHLAQIKTSSGEKLDIEFGFNRPSLDVGRFYKFTCEKKFGKLACSSFEASTAAAAPSASPARSGSTGKVFPVPADHPDRSIVRQNALAHATKVVVETSLKDAVTPSEDIVDLIIKTAYRFEAYATGDIEAVAIEALTKGE